MACAKLLSEMMDCMSLFLFMHEKSSVKNSTQSRLIIIRDMNENINKHNDRKGSLRPILYSSALTLLLYTLYRWWPLGREHNECFTEGFEMLLREVISPETKSRDLLPPRNSISNPEVRTFGMFPTTNSSSVILYGLVKVVRTMK